MRSLAFYLFYLRGRRAGGGRGTLTHAHSCSVRPLYQAVHSAKGTSTAITITITIGTQPAAGGGGGGDGTLPLLYYYDS